MDVTSDHLEVLSSESRSGFGAESLDAPDNGEELTKRSEHFGHPVGKRACRFIPACFSALTGRTDDPNMPPVLICKIRKGQELRIKCIAKKVCTKQMIYFLML
jgi:DNA-directed RNA polymerase II subunit RPB3